MNFPGLAKMADSLPKFDNPPVVETALSVQFARMPGFVTAMAGWFWKSHIADMPSGANWAKAREAARLEDHFERFDDQRWTRPEFRFAPAGESQRTQIIRSDEQRMVQVQDSRLILNWRKGSGAYPSYEMLIREFEPLYAGFRQFASDAGIGPIEENQWEITYVNRVPKGDMWQSTAVWRKILPFLSFPPVGHPMSAETLSADWRFAIAADRGRLYVGLRHAKTESEEEVMQLTLTARGPVDIERGWRLKEGFELGHEAIVRGFAAMTSEEAHKRWGRRD